MDDIILLKIEAINKCLARLSEEYGGVKANLLKAVVLDSIVLNLQRACESSIDLAMHIVRCDNLGIPQSSRNAFEKLEEAKIITEQQCIKMKRMVGFRNIAIHQYHQLDIKIVESILENDLSDFNDYIAAIKIWAKGSV
jgi:uncharacterized protein YutE (UPF0331/DUF86 family)